MLAVQMNPLSFALLVDYYVTYVPKSDVDKFYLDESTKAYRSL